MGHRYAVATGDKLVCLAVSQRANIMLARFKVNNSAHSGQTINVIGQYVKQQIQQASQPCYCPEIHNKFHEENDWRTFVLLAAA